ncbi:MAG TPA: methyltransferase domain-containing protein [Anaerolineaceae bacterium]|nr:methyltransferase domain-containing protein [Anaerolineaceae bacterium]
MKMIDIIRRQPNPQPWSEGEKIPWNDPAFSERMLKEHLSQAHDAASRRSETIDAQVEWIHQVVLKGRPSRILDLGCGPGLYASRLADLGHSCTGIDFSPASIAYAKKQANARNLHCQYFEADIRSADYGSGYDLVMSIFGEFNVFRPEDARKILAKSFAALEPGGYLLLEPHTFEIVRELGNQPRSWHTEESGLFSDKPYICLQENIWAEEARVAIQRYYIVDDTSGEVTSHSSSTQAHTDEEYRSLLAECGFAEVTILGSISSSGNGFAGLLGILARKPA